MTKRDDPSGRGGRLLLPALPLGRWAPLVLGAISVALVVLGSVRDDRPLVLLGVVGLAAVLVAFPLSHALLGRANDDHPGPDR